jgi:uncharacterized membrane protein YhaH (DUF805 family)
MNWSLFSFAGRANRAKYWLISLVATAYVITTTFVVIFAVKEQVPRPTIVALSLIWAIGILLLMWPFIAVGVKRLHDRNKSGWWLLLFSPTPGILQVFARTTMQGPLHYSTTGLVALFVATGISIWGFVELGCLRGTVGQNRFGPDPLGTPVERMFE